MPSSHGERDYVVAINHFKTTFDHLRNLRFILSRPDNHVGKKDVKAFREENNILIGLIASHGNWNVDPTSENIWEKIKRVKNGTISLLNHDQDISDPLRNDTGWFYYASEQVVESLYSAHNEENSPSTFPENLV